MLILWNFKKMMIKKILIFIKCMKIIKKLSRNMQKTKI